MLGIGYTAANGVIDDLTRYLLGVEATTGTSEATTGTPTGGTVESSN